MRRSKEEAARTRETVLHAALSLFSQHGYSQTTLAMIAKAAGYSRGPIYWHFRNKDELYEAVLDYSQRPLQQLVKQAAQTTDAQRAVCDFIDNWFYLLLEDRCYRQSFEILLNKTELTDALSRTLRRERRLTRSIVSTLGARLQQINPDQPAEQQGLLCYTFLMGITQSWLFSPKLFDLAALQPLFRQHLLRMLGLPTNTNVTS